MPTVLVPGVLRAEANGESHLAIENDGSLRAVLDEIQQRWPRLERRIRDESGALRRYVNVFVDGEKAALETPVTADAEVQVLPSVAGG